MRESVFGIQVGLVTLALAVLGAVNLPMPLHGDAALYQMGAQALADGAMLYRDFWDLKQPGIYLFHWLAGSVFGFTEVGLHTFEFLYLLGFAVLQALVLRRHFRLQWLAPIVPLLTVGIYFARATEWHLTQPAILLTPPLFAALALAAERPTPRRAALAGAAGGLAVVFKFAMVPVLGVLFVAAGIVERRVHGTGVAAVWRRLLLPSLLGGLVVICALASWLYAEHALAPFLELFHSWGPAAMDVRGPHPYGRVYSSLIWFLRSFAPWLVLAACARVGWSGLARERLFVLAGVVAVAGGISIATEPFAGWEFDCLMLSAPVALLAMRGLEGVLLVVGARYSSRGRVLVAAAVLLVAAAPSADDWLVKARNLAAYSHLAGARDHAFQRAVSAQYASLWASTAFLRDPASTPGPIYVFGDPLIQRLAQRPSAGSVHGWAWEIQPEAIWRRLEGELVAQPPAFVFADEVHDSMITANAPRLRALLDARFTPRNRAEEGTWYARVDGAAPSAR